MSDNDFDIDGLAKYLHITPQQVERLANRGKVPGRKVGGEWRFSQADIHHWMEARMGLLEDEELAKVEGSLAPTGEPAGDILQIRDMLSVQTIAIPLAANTRNAVIDQMARLAAATGLLWDPAKMADAVRSREQLQSTAMDNGVALLHPRRPLPTILAEPVMALGITSRGIPFGGSRSLTDIFFLICSNDDRGHLRTLARLNRLIGSEDFVATLRAASSAQQAYDLICQSENQLASY
jgi:PTS system nitrogen regulatory IIA component